MPRPTLSVVALAFTPLLSGQLTPQQKVDDFRAVVALYNRHYAPYETKIELFRFDLLDLRPWLPRIESSRTDLEYYGILREYVASLRDGHAVFNLPSTYIASLPFNVDLYDDRPLIDGINRVRAPLAQFPFEIGDELISVDGQTAGQWERRLSPYFGLGNARAARRIAVGRIPLLMQIEVPWAPEVPDLARVVIRRAATGADETYELPRLKSGVALGTPGRLPDPGSFAVTRPSSSPEADPDILRQLGRVTAPLDRAILGYGELAPIFRLPDGFTLRLGGRPSDLFFSGFYQADGLRIGYLRIPRFSTPANVDEEAELARYLGEIGFLQQATDGLIVDVMRNPGGQVSIVEGLAQTLMPRPFRAIGFEIRASWSMVLRFEESLRQARLANAPPHVIAKLTRYLGDVRQAHSENRGRTGPLPLASDTLDLLPFTLPNGAPLVYSKPLMVLTDEFSSSGADMFPAILRDNDRGILFGYRTNGAGGSVATIPAGPYSEGTAGMTQTLMSRLDGRYIENHGVEPDIVNDYMTRENLMTRGRPFVEAFTAAMADHIRRSPR